MNENEINTEQQKIEQKRNRMLHEPVEKLICQMAVPTIISMLVTAFYNLADTWFVGRLNSNSATGAVGLVYALMAIIQACGYFFGHGSGNYISESVGRGEYDKASKMAATGFYSCIFVGVIFAVFGLVFQNPLARLLGATDAMLADTLSYMRYILIGTPFMMASFTLNNQLRLQGNSFFSMIGLVSGAVFNVILDPLLIFTFGMGVAGAALATSISQFVSFIVLLNGCQKSSNVTIRLKNFTPHKEYFEEIVKGGLPSLGRQGLASVSTLLLNNYAGLYGDAAIAAFSVTTKIINISGSVILGFGQGFQPVCGFNYGAKRYGRVRRAFRFSVTVATVFMSAMAVVIFALAPDFVQLFRNDAEVIDIGAKVLRYECIAMPFLGFIIVMNMFLQNIRRVIPASILVMARQGIVFIPVLMILSNTLRLTGLTMAQGISDLITFLLALPLGLPVLKELKELERNGNRNKD